MDFDKQLAQRIIDHFGELATANTVVLLGTQFYHMDHPYAIMVQRASDDYPGQRKFHIVYTQLAVTKCADVNFNDMLTYLEHIEQFTPQITVSTEYDMGDLVDALAAVFKDVRFETLRCELYLER